jgi:uncharacterized membrane protein YraQ (UPF0718 family)
VKGLLRYKLFAAIILFDLAVLAIRPATGTALLGHSWRVFAQMLGILPPVFVLLGLLDVWVPRETVMRYVGPGSGIVGISLSILLGAAAAGPLYGAFPIAETMGRKGARYLNILVFLGAWSTLKIPMFLFELSALGVKFAVTRWTVNLFGIVAIAYLMDRLLTPQDKAVLTRSAGADGGS